MFSEINSKFRNFCFLALGFLMPFSAAAISIFMIFTIISTLIERSSYMKIYHILHIPLYQSFLLFLLIHLAGFFWLEVDSINWHKSWMVWMIPILAVSVDREIAKKGLYAFVLGMMFAELYVYFNIFSIWKDYLNGMYGDFLLPISHIAYNPFLAVSIALLLTTLLHGKYQNFRLVISIIFLITMVVNMFMTGGRAGQVGFIFIWLAISYFYLRNNKIALYGMLFALIFILFAAWNYSPVFKTRTLEAVDQVTSFEENTNKFSNSNSENSDNSENNLKTSVGNNLKTSVGNNLKTSVGKRIHFYVHSLKLVKERPLYGYGTGSFENIYNSYAENSQTQVLKTSNPHSNHLLILVQFGIFGFLVYLNIFYQQVRSANLMPIGYEFRAVAFVLPLFFILISFYDSYIWGHHTQALFAYLTAILFRPDVYQSIKEPL